VASRGTVNGSASGCMLARRDSLAPPGGVRCFEVPAIPRGVTSTFSAPTAATGAAEFTRMSDSANYALHRPEFLREMQRGEEKIVDLMRGKTCGFKAGAVLIDGFTEHQYIYRLLSGWVCRTRTLEDGRNQFILIFLPGDLFAVKSMFVTRHSDAVQALTDVVAERIHFRELHTAYRRDSDVASRCIWQVMEEERRLHNWIVGLGQGSAEERMAMLVLDLRARLTSSGALADEALTYELPLTQGQLGDYLGLTAAHVNRVLRALREEGVVTVRDGLVTIHSVDLLSRRAYPLLDSHERTSPAYVGAAPVETRSTAQRA
jgi:CRP/FNR family transcriptional regulator